MAFDPPLARAVQGMSAFQTISQALAGATGHSEPKAARGRISVPREELEDVVLAEL